MFKLTDNYKAFLALLSTADFSDCMDEYDVQDVMSDLTYEVDGSLMFYHGACRGCVIDKSADFVLKFDLFATGECEKELRIYQTAQTMRVEKVLLPLEFVCTVGKFDIYAQARFDYSHHDIPNNVRHKLHSDEHLYTITQAKYFRSVMWDLPYTPDSYWLAFVCRLYGKKFLRAFGEWASSCSVNDLHNGNIGYCKGKPVIIDYAGYFN